MQHLLIATLVWGLLATSLGLSAWGLVVRSWWQLAAAAVLSAAFAFLTVFSIGAFVAPNEDVRRKAAQVVGEDRFLVVHLAAPVEVCRERDTAGQYGRADGGEIANFPGVSSP